MTTRTAGRFKFWDRVTFELRSGRKVVGFVERVSQDLNAWPGPVEVIADDGCTWHCMTERVYHLGQQPYSI